MDISRIDNLFFTDRIEKDRACLSAEEMRHAIKVLRKRVGDELYCTDGHGTLYQGVIREIGKHEMWLEILAAELQKPVACRLTLAVAPTKSFDRIGWCIEKLTEIGIHQFIPLMCARSEREKWNSVRVRNIGISAMKQSRRVFLPMFAEPMTLADVLESAADTDFRYIAVRHAQSIPALKHYRAGSDVLILIGPEGDFTTQEIAAAMDHRFVPLNLGAYRLRTETAAIVAAATIQTLNQ